MEIASQFDVKRHDGSVEKLTEADLRTQVRGGKLLFEIMDRSGDVKKIWDPAKAVEVDDARRSFEDLTKKGYKAFHCSNEKGDQGDQMKEFDPKAGRVIFISPMVGG